MIHFANWKVTSWKRTVTDNNGSYDNNENHDTNNWLVVASGRTRRLVISCVFCVKWVGVMLTFIGLAHLRDATLLHVFIDLHNYVMLRYCTFSSIYTTTWCYATARSLQLTQVHRKVKTLVGSEVNPSLRRRCFQYVWRCNLQTCTPLVMLKELAKLVKNNDADNC